MLVLCNLAIPQALWVRSVRQNVRRFFFVPLVVNVGMWLERFIIVITSLHRDFLPSSWGMYYPTMWDWAVLIGTIGFFPDVLMILFGPSRAVLDLRSPRSAASSGAARCRRWSPP